MMRLMIFRRLGAVLLRAFDAVFVRGGLCQGWYEKHFLF